MKKKEEIFRNGNGITILADNTWKYLKSLTKMESKGLSFEVIKALEQAHIDYYSNCNEGWEISENELDKEGTVLMEILDHLHEQINITEKISLALPGDNHDEKQEALEGLIIIHHVDIPDDDEVKYYDPRENGNSFGTFQGMSKNFHG